MRYRVCRRKPSSTLVALRASWVTHAPFGVAVMPATSTRRVQILEHPAAQGLRLGGQAPALAVREPEPAGGDLLAQDPVLFLEIVDDIALLLVDPTGEGGDEKLERLRERTHTPERSRVPTIAPRWFGTRSPAQTRLLWSQFDREFGHYAVVGLCALLMRPGRLIRGASENIGRFVEF